MSRLSAIILATTYCVGVSTSALAHPHEKEMDKEKVETNWPNFGSADEPMMKANELSEKMGDMLSKHSDSMSKNLDKAKIRFEASDKDGLKEAARAIEDLIADSGLISGLADMVTELAEDIEVEEENGTKVFLFDGEKVGHFKMDRQREQSDNLSIAGLGKNLSIKRESYVKDGQTKTRIIIEMDGGEGLDIQLPEKSEAEE